MNPTILWNITQALWVFPWYRRWRRKKFAEKSTKKAKFNANCLSKTQIKEIDTYWKSYPGFKKLFHAFYTDATGHFFVNYMPDSLWFSVVDPFFNPDVKSQELDDKFLYERLFPIIKHPEMIMAKVNGFWISPDNNIISSNEVVDLLLKEDDFFIKVSVSSFGGHGVRYYDVRKGNRTQLESILASSGENIVIQKGIKQSPILSKLNPSSVNTIRMVSLLKRTGEVKVYSSILRMGINGSKVDNASSGGITVGIKDNGQLKENAFTATGIKYPHVHPDSKVEFSSVFIPNFSEIKQIIKKLHTYLPQFRLLSWDIALDEENSPIFVEVNMASGELDFHQLNNGPIFGDDTKEILDEVFGNIK